jgi:hypothetical protein
LLDSHIKALVEIVRAELSAIKEALGENKRAIDAASISQQNTGSGIERKIAEMRPDDEYKGGANTYKYKSYRQQVALNILTAILGVATIGAFCAAAYYACVARGQLDQMIKQYPELQKSAAAAKSAADTASDTLKASSHNFYIDERPYVVGDTFNVTLTTAKQMMHLEFRNAGKTPAVNLRIDPHDCSLLLGGKPILITSDEGIGGENVASDKTAKFDFPVALSDTGKSMFENEDAELIIKGKVLYSDVFGCGHQTRFCFAARAKWGITKFCATKDGSNDVDRNLCEQALTPSP